MSDQGEGDEFVFRDKQYLASQGLAIGKGVTGWVAGHGATPRLGDVRRDPRYLPLREDIRSELCVPLKLNN